MKNTIKELKEQAQELINCGNSKEKAEGYGMMRVIEEVSKYAEYLTEIDYYWESIPDEIQEKLAKKCEELRI